MFVSVSLKWHQDPMTIFFFKKNICIALTLELDIDTILVGGVHDQDRLRRC